MTQPRISLSTPFELVGASNAGDPAAEPDACGVSGGGSSSCGGGIHNEIMSCANTTTTNSSSSSSTTTATNNNTPVAGSLVLTHPVPPPTAAASENTRSSYWGSLKNRDVYMTASYVGKSPAGSPVTTAGMKTLRRGAHAVAHQHTGVGIGGGATGGGCGGGGGGGVSESSSSSAMNISINPSTSKIVDQALTVVQAHQRQRCHNISSCNSNTADADANASRSPVVGRDDDSSHPSSQITSGTANISGLASKQSTHGPTSNNLSFRKIAKKRRKNDGKDGGKRSSFHHTKSSKEYLRKAQEALKLNAHHDSAAGGSVSPHRRKSRFSQLQVPGGLSPRSNFAKQSLARSMLQSENTQTKRVGDTANDDDSDYDDVEPNPESCIGHSCDVVVMNNPLTSSSTTDPRPVASEPPATTTTTTTSTNDDGLGYEDADAVAANRDPATRRMGPARRRGSVTKFSLHAATAAKAATERILQLQGLSSSSTFASEEKKIQRLMGWTDLQRRRTPCPSGGMTSLTKLERHDLPQDDMISAEQPSVGHQNVDSISEGFSKHQLEAPSSEVTNAQPAQQAQTNMYGYEDPDSAPQPEARRHPRARRRGSVTKFSLEAAATVAVQAPRPRTPPPAIAAFETKQAFDDMEVSCRSDPDPSLDDDSSTRDSSDDEEHVEVVVRLKPPAPSRFSSEGEHEWLQESNQSPFFARRRSRLARRNSGDGFANPSAGRDTSQHSMSPRRRDSLGEISTGSRSFRSRLGRSTSGMSQNSGISFEDDADSVANDLESLCSMHDRGSLDVSRGSIDVAPVPPPPPIMSPLGTPSRSRKGRFNDAMMGDFTPTVPVSQGRNKDSHGVYAENLPFIAFPEDSDVVPVISYTDGTFPAPVKRSPSSSSANCWSKQSPSAAPIFSSICSGCTSSSIPRLPQS